MLAPPYPRQQDRLAALYSYEVLDTDPEKPFDDIVSLIAQICGTEVALISLVDAERQWFKAEVGLNMRETPLEMSVCSHVILQDEFVEIPDMLDDPRTSDNPICGGRLNMRFYAGTLLVSDSGLPIGTLCVLDPKPRQLTLLQRDVMRVLAQQVMSLLNLRRALKSADVMSQEVDHRVKNSLQAVSALTRLQARGLNSAEARDALDVVQCRIETVAALHEQLYRTDAGNKIDMAQYYTNVAEFMRGSAPENVKVHCNADSFQIDSKQAAALGVVLNEFATNSLKHGFSDGRAGSIDIRAELTPDRIVKVSLQDDGMGGETEMLLSSNGIGLKIIEASAEQLGGTYRVEVDSNGMRAHLEFPIRPASTGEQS